jgi:hypothetical protein
VGEFCRWLAITMILSNQVEIKVESMKSMQSVHLTFEFFKVISWASGKMIDYFNKKIAMES